MLCYVILKLLLNFQFKFDKYRFLRSIRIEKHPDLFGRKADAAKMQANQEDPADICHRRSNKRYLGLLIPFCKKALEMYICRSFLHLRYFTFLL